MAPRTRYRIEHVPRSAQQRFANEIGELVGMLGFADCDVLVNIVPRAPHVTPIEQPHGQPGRQPHCGGFQRYPYRGILSEIAAEDGVKRQAIRKRALRGDPDTLARIAAKMQERSAKVRRARNAMRRS